MKGLLFFLLLLSPSLRAQEPFVTPTYVKFLMDLDTFNRKLLGCPMKPDYITKEDCHPTLGELDLKLWKALNEQASKIFTYGQKTDDKESSHQSK